MHRYLNVTELRQIDYTQRVVVTPIKPRFHQDWEWKYDFPEIKLKLYKLFVFFIKSFYYILYRKQI